MRYALPGSALVHAAIFGVALIGFAWPQPEDAPAPGAVTVDIVSMSSVSMNETSTIESSAAEDRISAGGEATPPSQTLQPLAPDVLPAMTQVEQPLTPEPVEPADATTDQLPPVPPAPAEPLQPESVEPREPPADQPSLVQPFTAEPTPPEPVEPVIQTADLAILSTPLDPTTTAETIAPMAPPMETPQEATPTVAPLVAETLAPQSVIDLRTAPVPHILNRERPSEPTPRPRTQPPPPNRAGNGGQNNADTAAARAASGQQGNAGGGGTAEIAPWERQVRRALANARRYPRAANGASGEVIVRFTVSAAGALSRLSILNSSGNPILDQAALDTVTRAAPFPPIPAGVGLSSKTVDVPLGFIRN